MTWVCGTDYHPFKEFEERLKQGLLKEEYATELLEIVDILRKYYNGVIREYGIHHKEMAEIIAFQELFDKHNGRARVTKLINGIDLTKDNEVIGPNLEKPLPEKAVNNDVKGEISGGESKLLPEKGKNSSFKKQRRKDKNKIKKGKRCVSRLGRKTGCGNLSKKAFPNAEIKTILGENKGCCPSCHGGSLSPHHYVEYLRFEARPILVPIKVRVEHLRCSCCRAVFEAELPLDYQKDVVICKATPSAMATSIVMNYGKGFPCTRLEEMQKWQDAPFSNSNQWTIAANLYEQLKPLRIKFMNIAANADFRQVDDCSAVIISSKLAINEEIANAKSKGVDSKRVRTGINMTSYVLNYQGKEYRLFLAGREHQGEREYQLNKLRTVTTPLVRHADAASKATCLAPFPEKNSAGYTPSEGKKDKVISEPNTINANCWQHARDTLKQASGGFKRETTRMFQIISKLFDNDAQTSEMSADTRLKYHQCNSAPILEELKTRIADEIATNVKVEPNIAIHRAFSYFIKHWPGLTEFLRIPGIPLTTSKVELANKFTKQHHHNSLTFQTEYGAAVGAFFMSLIASCIGLNINPLKYIEALARYRSFINANNTTLWLPDTFTEGIKLAETEIAAQLVNKSADKSKPQLRLCHRRITKEKELFKSPNEIVIKENNTQIAKAL